MIAIQGGTHLGIVGRYGERDFDTNNLKDVEDIIREEQGLQVAKKSRYIASDGAIIHTLINEEGLTLFEYCVVKRRDNKEKMDALR